MGIAIAYETFIKQEETIQVVSNGANSLGTLGQFILDYSKDLPTFYGLTSVVMAVVLGIAAAIIRRLISNWNKNRIAKLKTS